MQKLLIVFCRLMASMILLRIREVMAEDVIWIFLGQHPLAGVKNGIEEVVAFFDNMGAIMGSSKVKAENWLQEAMINF